MNYVEHAMIDGSVLSISGDADLSVPPDCFGRVHVRALNAAYRFEVHRPGFSYQMEAQPPPLPKGTTIGPISEFSLRDGVLRTVQAEVPHPHGWVRHVTLGSWEGKSGCIWTSKSDCTVDEMVAMYDSVDFVESDRGVYFTSPIEPDFRSPSCLKDINARVLLEIWPLSPLRMRRLPARKGTRTAGGSLYRINDASAALLLVTDTVQASIDALDAEQPTDEYLSMVNSLKIEWRAASN